MGDEDKIIWLTLDALRRLNALPPDEFAAGLAKVRQQAKLLPPDEIRLMGEGEPLEEELDR
jgi:hypothetical protein